LAGFNTLKEPPMGRACICASGFLAAVAFLAGGSKAALASEESSIETSPALRDYTLITSPGFDLVRTSERPPELVDYTIASLMRLATPWPIERTPAGRPADATAEPPASVEPAPVEKANAKPSPRPKTKTQKPQQKSSRVTAEWWRSLFWLRIR
jgi:hypothetical protein